MNRAAMHSVADAPSCMSCSMESEAIRFVSAAEVLCIQWKQQRWTRVPHHVPIRTGAA